MVDWHHSSMISIKSAFDITFKKKKFRKKARNFIFKPNENQVQYRFLERLFYMDPDTFEEIKTLIYLIDEMILAILWDDTRDIYSQVSADSSNKVSNIHILGWIRIISVAFIDKRARIQLYNIIWWERQKYLTQAKISSPRINYEDSGVLSW